MSKAYIFALIPLVPAFLLDIVYGDPPWLHHPVRIIGRIITICQKFLRGICSKTPTGERLGGGILALIVPVFSFFTIFLLLQWFIKIHIALAIGIEIGLCYQMLALKSLKVESDKVKNALLCGDIDGARKWLSYIVGRDTQNLDEQEIIRATVETVAENTSDGVIAPMCYIGAGGACLCYFYKAVNTLDSMVGYKNKEYEYFGQVSARFDDVLNYLPSRISGILMILAAFLCRMNYRNAWNIFLRDRNNHPSPNSAQTEAACAGALDIQLGGGSYYKGVFKEKPTIGDNKKPLQISDIDKAQKLMLVSSILGCLLITMVRALIICCIGG